MSTSWSVAVITVSDRSAAGERDDATGPALASVVRSAGLEVATTRIVPDGVEGLIALIHELAPSHDLLLLAGGTGIGPRDHTPEAVEATCDRMIPGVGEAIRAASREAIPAASLSRACAGVRGTSVVVAVPGSPGGATDAWGAIRDAVPHALEQVAGTDHPG
jgi:molybdenum cofactor synthesis domain-containing protein